MGKTTRTERDWGTIDGSDEAVVFAETVTEDGESAEDAKFRAEAAAHAALEVKHRAEARKLLAEAERAEIELAARKRKERDELAGDDHHYVYQLDDHIDAVTVAQCIEQLNLWDRTTETPGEITIVICSPGGSVIAGMALFDHISAMRAKGWHFKTIARGYAASMGGILLQAGDERIIGPEAYILIHEVSTIALGKIGEIEDEVEFVKKIQERVLDIFVRRSGGKVSKATLRSRWRRKDWWLDSDEALRLGIADRIA